MAPRTAALLLGLLLLPAPAEVRKLTILHTNDLHARLLPDDHRLGGFAHLATALRRELQGCASCLYLNGGDSAQGTPVSTLFRGLPIFEVLRLMPPHAAALGNHEFDYGWRRIAEFQSAARFPILAANVQDPSGRLLTGRAWTILTAGGLRVGVIGVLTEMLPELTTPDLTGPWRALPVLPAVRRHAAELRDRADLLVVVSHITEEEERAVLTGVPEVGVIVSGHRHGGLQEAVRDGPRVLVRVKSYGVELGRLDLEIDTAAKLPVSSAWKRIPIDAGSFPPAPDIARTVARWEAKVSKVVDVPIGESRREFREPDVKLLMERAMIDETGADLAFQNLGGVRGFLPQGRLLARHVWTVMPFDNQVVLGTFPGRDLPEALRKGRILDPGRDYVFATSDFVAASQQSALGTTGLVFPRTGRLLRDVFVDWIKKQKVLDTALLR